MRIETHMQRLNSLGEWAEETGYSHCTINVNDLLWAVDRLNLLEQILGDDMDIDGPLSDPAPIEPSTLEEQE